MKKLIFSGFIDALGVAIYTAVIALVMQNGDKLFGADKNYLAPVAFLLIFVLSAAITGFLVVGRPVMMYLDGKRVEAVKLLGYTLVWLCVFVIAISLVVQIWI